MSDEKSLDKQSIPLERSSSTTSATTQPKIAPQPDHVADADLQKPEPAAPEPEYPSTWKMVILILALDLAVFLVALDQTIIATAIPKITDRFHSIEDVGWYGSAYFLTSTALQPSFGRVYKIFNVSLSRTRWLCEQLLTKKARSNGASSLPLASSSLVL